MKYLNKVLSAIGFILLLFGLIGYIIFYFPYISYILLSFGFAFLIASWVPEEEDSNE